MSKLTRKLQKIFGGSLTATNNISQFGSLKNGTPNYSTDPDTIQALTAWLNGWNGAVIASAPPPIQDMNAVHYLLSRQLAYLMQAGVAEWDTDTTYYIGSFASDGLGNIYYSLTDGNQGHALSNATYWFNKNLQPTQQIFLSGSGTYTLPAGTRWIRVRMVGGGGGGGSSNISGAGTNGAAGVATTFGSAFLTASPGGGGFSWVTASSVGGSGGATTVTGGFGVHGGSGSTGTGSGGSYAWGWGGAGGNSALGGGGGGAITTGIAGAANTGGGGGGGSTTIQNSGTTPGGGGGGAGGFLDAIITSPSATYSYAVGTGGAGGTDSGGGTGGAGGSGIIIVNEFYS